MEQQLSDDGWRYSRSSGWQWIYDSCHNGRRIDNRSNDWGRFLRNRDGRKQPGGSGGPPPNETDLYFVNANCPRRRNDGRRGDRGWSCFPRRGRHGNWITRDGHIRAHRRDFGAFAAGLLAVGWAIGLAMDVTKIPASGQRDGHEISFYFRVTEIDLPLEYFGNGFDADRFGGRGLRRRSRSWPSENPVLRSHIQLDPSILHSFVRHVP